MYRSTIDPLLNEIEEQACLEIQKIKEESKRCQLEQEQSFNLWKEKEYKKFLSRVEEYEKEGTRSFDLRAEMAEKKLFLNAQESLLKRIEAHSLKELEKEAKTPQYREILKSWIIEGALALGESSIFLLGSNLEKPFFTNNFLRACERDLYENYSRKVNIVFDQERLQTQPGVLLLSQEGSVFYNNQFRPRFKRKEREIRQLIFQSIKGEIPLKEEINGE